MTTTTGPGRWEELGPALIRRRIAIDSRYHNRGAFCEATGLSYRLVYDIEEHRRTNFGSSTLAAIEQAYRLEPGSVRRFLGGGELDSAGAPAASRSPQADPPVAMDPELEKAARPYVDVFAPELLGAAARTGMADPPGGEIFEAGSWEAQTWERMRRGFPDPWRRLWLIAATLGTENEEPGRQQGTGLTAS